MTLEEARQSGLPISTGAATDEADRPERSEKLTASAPAAQPPEPDPPATQAPEAPTPPLGGSVPAPEPEPEPEPERPLMDRIREARELLEGCGCTVLDEPQETQAKVVQEVVTHEVLADALPAAPLPTFGWHLGQSFSLSGSAIACAYETSMRIISGVRTLAFFGVSGVLALGQATSTIDVSPLVDRFLPQSVTGLTSSQLILLMSLAGIWLRLVTKTPSFHRWRGAAFGATVVDSPEGEK